MKKFIYVFFVLIIVVFALLQTACKVTMKSDDSESVCVTMNEFAKINYNSIKLTVTMTDKAKTLSGSYEIMKSDGTTIVNYEYQRFAQFVEINGILYAPENEIESMSGQVVIKDGYVIESSGSELNITVAAATANGFSFDKSYFENMTVGKNRFVASVVDTNAFVGIENADKMTVSVDYLQNSFSKIKINYSLQSKNYTLEYIFN